jgi:myo-inositol-1-phosphate synthase
LTAVQEEKGLIRVAVAGVGNCCSALVQGIAACRADPAVIGLPFPVLGGYPAGDIEVVAAFDIDARKVGRDLTDAIFAPPNCTSVFHPDLAPSGVTVRRGPTLDGLSSRTGNDDAGFRESPAPAMGRAEIVTHLRATGCEVLVIFLPVGALQAAALYAECALDAGVAVVNGIPVFLASDPDWAARFAARGLPLLGDDFKSQLGATVLHRALAGLFGLRGAQLDRTYQLNVGGNTDFLNMTDGERLAGKRHSKTEAVQQAAPARLPAHDIRVGPSDYVPWLSDRKVAYLRTEGRIFGGAAIDIEVRMSVEDSPNAAAMALAAIRCARIARDRGLGGAIAEPGAFLFKHPPRQMDDRAAHRALLDFAGDADPDD